MTPDQLAEIIRKLLKERRLPENAVRVIPPEQNNLVFAVRFGSRVSTQCLVDPEWESQESLFARLVVWLDTETRASKADGHPDA